MEQIVTSIVRSGNIQGNGFESWFEDNDFESLTKDLDSTQMNSLFKELYHLCDQQWTFFQFALEIQAERRKVDQRKVVLPEAEIELAKPVLFVSGGGAGLIDVATHSLTESLIHNLWFDKFLNRGSGGGRTQTARGDFLPTEATIKDYSPEAFEYLLAVNDSDLPEIFNNAEVELKEINLKFRTFIDGLRKIDLKKRGFATD